jgi:hypothetical protein
MRRHDSPWWLVGQQGRRMRTVPAMSYIPTLLHAIENRLDETTTEIGHLEAALSALTTSTTTTAEARPGKSRTTRQRRRASTMRTGTPLDSETAAVTAAPEPAEPITNTIDPDPSRPVEPKPTAEAPDSTPSATRCGRRLASRTRDREAERRDA